MGTSLKQGKPRGFEVNYRTFTINGRMLGHGEPIRVKQGERVLFHVLNGSATEIRSLALPGHPFTVLAMDGNPLPKPVRVPVLWLGTAERISALVEMNHRGNWILGDTADDDRHHGMGIVVEYAGQTRKPQWVAPPAFADKTRRYWTAALIGYAVNMLAVPALALAGNWPAAAALVVAERTGRAIRRPAVESMLSNAGKSIGQGWVFGLNEALDQTGATLGPLLAALVMYRHGSYRAAFATLLIPALLCLATVVVASTLHSAPQQFEQDTSCKSTAKGFSRTYWLYTIAGALIAAGFADFSLIAFHLQRSGSIAPNWIPVFYSVAMATGAFAAPVFGRLFDKLGLAVLLFAFGIPAFFAPLVFLRTPALEMAGMVLWGAGMGAQDSCLKAAVAHVIQADKRSTAFGSSTRCSASPGLAAAPSWAFFTRRRAPRSSPSPLPFSFLPYPYSLWR